MQNRKAPVLNDFNLSILYKKKGLLMLTTFLTTILLCCSSFCFGHDLQNEKEIDLFLDDTLKNQVEKKWPNYHNFTRNPSLSHTMKKLMAPYLLPEKHPTKPILDTIFSSPNVIKNDTTLKKAGFKILFSQKKSFIRVVGHPLLKGYLLKLYPNSERRIEKGPAGWKRLTVRCIVAEKIKRIIKEKKVHTFVVADKWLYPLPVPKHRNSKQQPIVLIVKNMNIFGRRESNIAWKTKASWSTIKGLYQIFSRGYGSAFLSGNLPYTKDHKFAFIDTEYDKRKISMRNARRRFSPKMRKYWNSLLRRRGSHMIHMGVQDDGTIGTKPL